MGFLNNILGEVVIEPTKLAETGTTGKQYSLGGTVKVQEPMVSFNELELAYKSDAINFTAINRSVQMIMSGGFKEFSHIKATVSKKFKEFFENIGEIGNDITFDELLESIFRNQMIYGNSFVEIIFNDTEDKIVDLALIDPKKIDYAKTNDGKIILDRTGKSIGYIIKFNSDTYAEGDKVPEKYERHIKSESNSIFLLAKRICHFKLYPVGDGFYGIGLLEPSYKSVLYKKNIEKGQANSIYAKGFNPIIGYVGNERKMATPKDLESVNKKLIEIESTKVGTFPDWVKIDTLKMDSTNLAESALKDMRVDQFASLGTPEGLVSKGEGVNKSVLGDQRVIWEFTLKDIIKQTMSYFKKYILKALNEYNQFGGVPDVKWEELKAENIDNTTASIIRLLTSKSNQISEEFRSDLEGYLRDLMNVGKYKKTKKQEDPKKVKIEEEQINKKVIEEKDKKELKSKLNSIDNRLSDNLEEIKQLKLEKQNMEKEYKEENLRLKEDKDTEKEKLMARNIQILEEQIKTLNENAVEKLSERDKVINSLSTRVDIINKDGESADLKLESLKLNKMAEEKKLKVLERKENLIKKLEEDLENGK